MLAIASDMFEQSVFNMCPSEERRSTRLRANATGQTQLWSVELLSEFNTNKGGLTTPLPHP